MKIIEKSQHKQLIYVFELDNCIANSTSFLLTNKEAFTKDKALLNRRDVGFRGKLTKQNENDLSEAYLVDHQSEIKPYYSILDLFVRLSKYMLCIVIVSRSMLLKQSTIAWLERFVSNIYGYQTWRQISYKLYFNEFEEKTINYKKRVIDELTKQYNINTVVTNDLMLIKYLQELNISYVTSINPFDLSKKKTEGKTICLKKNMQK